MDEDLYDEFGNYIGPEISENEDEDYNGNQDSVQYVQSLHNSDRLNEGDSEKSSPSGSGAGDAATASVDMDLENENNDVERYTAGNAIVLAEDKKYYPTAEETYGPEIETMLQEEDAQPITEPIIAPLKANDMEFRHTATTQGKPALPPTKYDKEYMVAALLATPQLVRNVAVVGHLHHGKTRLMDLLIEATHILNWEPTKQVRYTDTRIDEQKRGLSIKCCPFTVLMQNLSEKSIAFNFIDTPGHPNFFDEVLASIRLSDGILLVIDAVEGVMSGTERLIHAALMHQLDITVVISKIDRLILELRLPPSDAFYKIRHTIVQVNKVIQNYPLETGRPKPSVNPKLGNVCFASAEQGWCFSLPQFAKLYLQIYPTIQVSPKVFAKRLWGDVYFDSRLKKFTKVTPLDENGDPIQRSFITFILEPLYKLSSLVVGESCETLAQALEELGIGHILTKSQLQMDVKPLLKLCGSLFFQNPTSGLADMLYSFVRSPIEAASVFVESLYTGPLDTELSNYMLSCDQSGPLMILVSKLISTTDKGNFLALGRIVSGKVNSSEQVRILGDDYNPDYDDEDQSVAVVSHIYVPAARYRIEVKTAVAGQVVLLDGVDNLLAKGATIVSANNEHCQSAYIFRPLKSSLETGVTAGIVRVAIEPLKPSELPKMTDGLRKCNKTYPALKTRIEESGEHAIFGTGELYMDSVLYDLRNNFSDIKIKVSDPSVPFAETISEMSSLKCYAESSNRKNKITMIAEPLEEKLPEDIEKGNLKAFFEDNPSRHSKASKILREVYDWDILATRSLWAFGPDSFYGPNCLVDDVLPGIGESDKTLMNASRESIIQGFQWATREGPLCDEPVRGVKFRITDAVFAPEPILRSGAQVIPTARRVAYSAFLTASPRLMEPIYAIEVICPSECIPAVYTLLSKRRGNIVHDSPKAGTPMFIVDGYMPVLESFGFETDLRSLTQGQAFVLSWFDHFGIIPGDPMAKDIVLRPLEPSPPEALAKECMIKTRRRKGMSEDVSIAKYFDDPLLLALQEEFR